jgi:hypothetical protein
MACETHAPLFWESEPLSTLAHKPLPNSNSAILSPSICFISELHVGLTIPIYPKSSLRAALFRPGCWNKAAERQRTAWCAMGNGGLRFR